jgi:hypothetical protein
MIYYYINLPWNERRAHIWIGHSTFFHLSFVYECGMDQKYMHFGIKKQLQIIYDMWCIHCIYVTIWKFWSFDHIKVVANWIGHKSFYVSWLFVYILTIQSRWKSQNDCLKLYFANYNKYIYILNIIMIFVYNG